MNPICCEPKLKIFLVDDPGIVRQRLASMLVQIGGVEVVGMADDLDTALESLIATHANVLMLDSHLTSGSGLNMINAVKRHHLPVVMIVLTNHSNAAIRTACLSAGANYFFDKTTEYEQARAVIENLARRAPLSRTQSD
ncbi:response regulator [Caballeronia arationis]|jgi:DNA-binding NarL/FixJ family response regulator|nr:response regulator [Caballeronia arationis]